MMNHTPEYWIKNLNLIPHPEGGFYTEVYRSDESISTGALPARYTAERSFCTSIYFLLRSSDISAFHKIASDEIWYFHEGSTVEIFILKEKGLQTIQLGKGIDRGELFQALIPKGHWFGAKVADPDSFVLVSCSVSPGFDFNDFVLAKRMALIKKYPSMERIIRILTKD